MIYHLSIEGDHPQHVASVLAELFGGRAFPFPPVSRGSWIAMAGDDRSSGVEVYPRGTRLIEAEGDADAIGLSTGLREGSATHFAMATPLDAEAVTAIATREGWPIKYRKRGGAFGVLELWIEGRQMVEVLTPEMQAEYLEAVTIPNWEAMLAAGPPGGKSSTRQAS